MSNEWAYDPKTNTVFDASGKVVADRVTESDGALIVAAPDLLELAELAADVIDDDLEERPARHPLGNLHARLKAAIKKARQG